MSEAPTHLPETPQDQRDTPFFQFIDATTIRFETAVENYDVEDLKALQWELKDKEAAILRDTAMPDRNPWLAFLQYILNECFTGIRSVQFIRLILQLRGQLTTKGSSSAQPDRKSEVDS